MNQSLYPILAYFQSNLRGRFGRPLWSSSAGGLQATQIHSHRKSFLLLAAACWCGLAIDAYPEVNPSAVPTFECVGLYSHQPTGSQATHTAALGVFDAPEPWGPWTTVFFDSHWSGTNRTYHHKFPTKWMSSDGRTLWLLYSGLDGGLYTFCLNRVDSILR